MPKKRQPREIWEATCERIFQRDGGRCVHCGVEVVKEYGKANSVNIDHVVSGKRGSNADSNLRTLCLRCHTLRYDHRHRGMILRALELGIIPADWRHLVWED
jgi:5-methylcytosine-specific restriction protein A